MSELSKERELSGLSVSNGIAHGEAFVMLQRDVQTPVYEVRDSDKSAEIERFQNAIIKTRKDLETVKSELSDSVGEAEASIFDAHILVLEDVAIIQDTMSMFEREHYNIEYCYSKVINKFITAFERIDDPYIRDRIADLKDVSRRVIDNMMGVETAKIGAFSDPLILVSTDFTPSDFSLVDKSKILAIISEKGSQTSHTAILARSLGVPCIVGISNIVEQISSGEMLLVDGYKGKVIVNPSESTLGRYTEVESVHRQNQKMFDTALPYPSETQDGKQFSVEINISSPSDIPEPTMKYIDGIGLFRTENFFLETGFFPDEEIQFSAYKSAAEKSLGKPVVIRTLDLGGDKNFKLLKQANHEENPFMGYRAIRFCLDHKDVFLQQIRAILRASAFGKIKILLPMISSIREVERARVLIEQAKEDLSAAGEAFDKNIEVGAMIEVPSAAITVDIIAQVCDFISIGTNDLIQYLLAVDRVNDMVAHLYEPTHPAVLRTLNYVVTSVRKMGKPVGVCGELAANPIFAPLLLGMGVTEFSMSANSVSEIKFLLRKTSFEDARKLRDEVLQMQRSRHIISKLRSFHYESMQPYIP
ncbi:phosphoenolpyruvate-protein phosphotransferase [Coraliomargarita sp. CAG:312]|nr:phosphoenolpyruvate-protein phosphotransferase [Coraliomargarita sp. CAG:312]